MRQARDLLYLLVHLGSNPNPGASFSGVFHQLLLCEHERISCGLIHLLDSNTAAYGYSTAGHHIAPAFQAHGVGDSYGCSCPSQGTGNMLTCEVTYQRLASGPGSVDVFGICS